jgi:uncharacterized protein YjiS (DUF1127 family)
MTEIASVSAAPGIWRAFFGAIRRPGARMARTFAIWRQQRMLHGLSDGLLKDIGVSRSDINYFAVALVEGREDPTRRRRG